MSELRRMVIGGQQVDGGAGGFVVLNPADGATLYEVADASRADVVRAIENAAEAQRAWGRLPFTERAQALLKAADVLEARQKELAVQLVREGGAWIGKCMYEAGYAAGIYRAAAAAAYQPIGEILPSNHNKVSLAVRRPLGVVAAISPWNFPLLLSSRGIAFALAAGNAVVLKPSEETPVTGGLLLAEALAEAGVPEGVLNVVTCSRESVAEVGDELIAHPLVKAITFTGSTAVGRRIAAQAGGLLKKACVELGGKDPMLVLADADMDRAVNAAVFGSFMHAGQICMSAERLLVHRSRVEEFTEKVTSKVAALGVGDPMRNVIGPVINKKQLEAIHAQVEDARAQGASIHAGGSHEGLYYQPTVVSGVHSRMKLFRDETFGPVAAITAFETEDQAVALANDCEYGLSSAIITADEEHGLELADRLESGMTHINDCPVYDEPHAPFGGVKGSGLGRHGGRWAMEAFTETHWRTLEKGGRKYPF